MKKVVQIAFQEYRRHVLRWRFVLMLLGMPLLIGFMAGVVMVMSFAGYDSSPIGYVDLSGFLEVAPILQDEERFFTAVEMLPYEAESTAQSALRSGEIQAYYVLEENYWESGEVRLVSIEPPGEYFRDQFRDTVRQTMLRGQPEAIAARVTEGARITVRSMDGAREISEDDWLDIVLPMFSGIIFILAINLSSGYLLHAIVEEKENRTMEVIITSVSPNQLMAGKIAGNLGAGLTTLLGWILLALACLELGRILFFPGQSVTADSGFIWLVLLTMLPAFIMLAALMAAVGAMVTESREAQQISVLFTLPIMMPYWFAAQIMMHPNSPVAIGFSLFPLTSPVSMPMRAAFTDVPAGQWVLAIGLLMAGAGAAVWLAGRAFHLGMLRYGKRLRLKDLIGKS